MISENEEYTYNCFVCDKELSPYFYVCSRIHVFCGSCSSMGGFCPICQMVRILCCDLEFYETSLKGPIFEKSGGLGPVISLPELKDFSASVKTEDEDSTSPKTRVVNCLDCQKLLSGTMVFEHYHREHPNTPISPIPPGACLSFKFRLADIPDRGMKRMQVLKLVNHDQFFPTFDFEDENKLLFIVATRVPFFEKNNTILFWITPHFTVSSYLYSIEARSELNNRATAMFTGKTIGSIEMNEVMIGKRKLEDLGNYLSVKETLIKALENKGEGIVISTIIHDETSDSME